MVYMSDKSGIYEIRVFWKYSIECWSFIEEVKAGAVIQMNCIHFFVANM